MTAPQQPAIGDLRGRTALVTGGGSGLGRAIAWALSDAGAHVIAVGRDESRLDAVVRELHDAGGSARAVACDISLPQEVDVLARALPDDVSILVNNAGVGGPVADLVDIDPATWDEVFAVNVRGTYLMCRALLPRMVRAGRGDIVNIASVTGKRPLRSRTPYAASKMAVIGLTSTLAWEVGPLGISVNALSPGPVVSDRMRRNFALEAERSGRSYDDAEREFVSRSALQRMITESEVGRAVVAVLGMPGLTGSDIDLSAGMVA
ncbi:SDR family NAD(P)-dependent oxidoreductase [Microbacterium sp. 179-I 3D2 NHS]|uniref:SDR family NAD(P)-dependent oxidoreductase n=1 Tax=Microbacterium sp. 179-I 3D2 NHS TaxID=3235178 RepID=UPI0039A1871D